MQDTVSRFVLTTVLIATAGFAQDNPLRTLRKQHPRLIATIQDFERVRRIIASDGRAKELYGRLADEGRKLLTAETIVYEKIGPRLLTQSRRALDRIYTLSLLYRVSRDKAYLDRVVREMRAAADFPDWNPSHFLDTAEMTHALSIGYDWLFDSLTPQQRSWIKEAIVEKGIKAAVPIYKEQRWWVRAHHNWNQVCNGGIGMGALAVADEEPDLAGLVIRSAIQSIPLAMNSYAPDGGWNEGPGYWHYATRYNVYFLAALETALGADFGLSKLPGFERAGHFRVYFSGPSDRTFNYADAGDDVGTAEEMFWLARRFKQPVYAWHEHQQLARRKSVHALDLVWFQRETASPDLAKWPLNMLFRGVNTAFLRSSWTEADQVFAGIKGGDNKANHSHLDLGTFVIDVGSSRFAADLGPDDYNLPQYFGKLRWTYYRLNTDSHNTILIDSENQDPKAEAPVTDFDPGTGRTVINMTGAYPGKLKNWTRTMQFSRPRQISLRDRIEAAQPVEALWGMVTEAEVALDGRRATLTRNGRKLVAEIRSPAEAKFEVIATQPPKPQRQNEGTRKLVVRLPAKVESLELLVTFTPAEN